MRKLILPLILLMFFVVSAAAQEVIKEYSGSETVSVGPLTLPDDWKIQWETKGQYLQILMNTPDNVPLGYAVEQIGQGKGVSKPQKAGDYILDFNVSGEWKVQIVK